MGGLWDLLGALLGFGVCSYKVGTRKNRDFMWLTDQNYKRKTMFLFGS